METIKLMNHTGAQVASMADVAMVPVPQSTESYHALPHTDFIYELTNMAQKLIGNTGIPQMSLAKEGNRLFGILPISVGKTDEYEFALGFRNSYDKSMTAGVCFGNRVFVCDNLAFRGNITIMRKHTKNIRESLSGMLVTKLMQAESEIAGFQNDFVKMKETNISKEGMAKMLGLAVYNDILKPRQFATAMEEINVSKAFQGNTIWDLYQHGTEALKQSPIEKRIESCTNWHNFVMQEV